MKDTKNSLSIYLRELYKIPVLPKEQEIELAERIQQGDDEALEKLITHNLRLVVWFAKRQSAWDNSKVPIEDIIAFGNEYLLLAARNWKPDGSASFGAYANRFIRLGINREVAKTENIVSLPIGITEKIRKIQYNERILTQQLGRPPRVEELAEKTGFTIKRINTIKSILMREPVSLDALISQNITEDEEE